MYHKQYYDKIICGHNQDLGNYVELIEKEKISLVRSYSRWTAFYVGPRADSREAEQVGDTAIEAVVKCFIEKKLGSEI